MPASSLLQDETHSQSSQPPDPSQMLLQFAAGYVPAAALWIAAELGIADLLGAQPVSVTELARSTGANEDALFRILRVLAMVGIFSETEPRHFALTPSPSFSNHGADSACRIGISPAEWFG